MAYAQHKPTIPMMIPMWAISLVLIIPVEQAMAFGGVLIGRVIAKEVAMARPTSIPFTPPTIAMSGPIAEPMVAKRGINRLAAAELLMKFERP